MVKVKTVGNFFSGCGNYSCIITTRGLTSEPIVAFYLQVSKTKKCTMDGCEKCFHGEKGGDGLLSMVGISRFLRGKWL